VIDPSNAAQLQRVAQLGQGFLTDVAWSPDGGRLAVASALGVYLYDVNSLAQTSYINTNGDAPRQVFFSPDGTQVAAFLEASETLRYWEVASGQELRALSWTERAAPVVSQVGVSPDGATLAWIARGTVQLMDSQTGNLLQTLSHEDFVSNVDFSPDGSQLVTLYGGVIVWDVASGQPVRTLVPYPEAIANQVEFSPGGASVMIVSSDGQVSLWDVGSGQQTLSLSAVSAEFAPDGQSLVADSGAGEVLVVDAASGESRLSVSGTSAALSPDGSLIAVQQDGGAVQLVEAASGAEQSALPHAGVVDRMSFLPNGRLLTVLTDGTLTLWDTTSGQALLTLGAFTGAATSLAFGPDSRLLAVGSADQGFVGSAHLWSLTVENGVVGGQVGLALRGHNGAVQSVAFSADGLTLASASEDTTVKLWNLTLSPLSAQERATLTGHTQQVTSVALSPDGSRAASGSWDQTVKIWDAASGAELLTLAGPTAWVWSVTFSPDGRYLAAGSDDGVARVWEVVSGQLVFASDGQARGVMGVAFSPDGRLLAGATGDGPVLIWGVPDGAERMRLPGHPDNTASSVAFSPDGKLLASSGWDGSVIVWDATSGAELATLGAEPSVVAGALRVVTIDQVAFSPDGQLLAAALADGTAQIWAVSSP
jgi:WD40 repeat protein